MALSVADEGLITIRVVTGTAGGGGGGGGGVVGGAGGVGCVGLSLPQVESTNRDADRNTRHTSPIRELVITILRE